MKSCLFLWLALVLTLSPLTGPASAEAGGDKDEAFRKARLEMVARNIETEGIRDPAVLQAMRAVPRHLFVPPELKPWAYVDQPLPIGYGQTISQPYVVAYMTELLGLRGGERVLEIGTGSGYQSAVLAEIAGEVMTIEIVATLARTARRALDQLGYRNIRFRIGDGYDGWPERAPFDAIIVTAAPTGIPEPLTDQLKVGGRLIAPVGLGVQELILQRKTATGVSRDHMLPVRFVPMTGRATREGQQKAEGTP